MEITRGEVALAGLYDKAQNLSKKEQRQMDELKGWLFAKYGDGSSTFAYNGEECPTTVSPGRLSLSFKGSSGLIDMIPKDWIFFDILQNKPKTVYFPDSRRLRGTDIVVPDYVQVLSFQDEREATIDFEQEPTKKSVITIMRSPKSDHISFVDDQSTSLELHYCVDDKTKNDWFEIKEKADHAEVLESLRRASEKDK